MHGTTRADIHSRCYICGSSVRPVHEISIDVGLVHIGPVAGSTGSVDGALLLLRPQIQTIPDRIRINRIRFRLAIGGDIASKNKLERESIFNLNLNPA